MTVVPDLRAPEQPYLQHDTLSLGRAGHFRLCISRNWAMAGVRGNKGSVVPSPCILSKQPLTVHCWAWICVGVL